MNQIITEMRTYGYKTRDDLVPWQKSYWYLRILIDTNRYGAIAKDVKRINNLQNNILTTYKHLSLNNESEEEKMDVLKSILQQSIFDGVKEGSKKLDNYVALCIELKNFLLESKDYFILGIVIKELLLPTNEAIKQVPTTESTEFAKKYAKAILDVKKEKGLSNLIREWDVLTEDISLNKERDIIISLFHNLKTKFNHKLSYFDESATDEEIDVILTAICQEFERRAGQKRKQRAGNDLESATDFILKYFNIPTAGGPEHITAGLEVDNWVMDNRGWYIGISLKRTLRERWKQTYTTEIGLYDRHKIKHIIHILNNDYDLSDSTITELGSYRHLFFIADDSNLLKDIQSHVAMGQYLYPMSELISKLKELMGVRECDVPNISK